MKKRLNLFLIVLLLLAGYGCRKPEKSPEELLADFIRTQKNFEYRNFEASGTGKIPEQTLQIVGDSNGNTDNPGVYWNVQNNTVVSLDNDSGNAALTEQFFDFV